MGLPGDALLVLTAESVNRAMPLPTQEDWSEVDPSIDETVYGTVKAELIERVRAAQTSQAALVALLKSSMFSAADHQQVLLSLMAL